MSNNSQSNKDEQGAPNIDQSVSDIYQSAAKATPSKALDEAVLAMAKKRGLSKKRKQTWLHWQYGGSIAASVLLVSFIYLYNIGPQAPQELHKRSTTSTSSTKLNSPAQVASEQEDDEISNDRLESIVVTGARINPRALELAQQADELLLELKILQADTARFTVLQSELFTTLQALSAQDRNWELDEDFYPVLSQKQIAMLKAPETLEED